MLSTGLDNYCSYVHMRTEALYVGLHILYIYLYM